MNDSDDDEKPQEAVAQLSNALGLPKKRAKGTMTLTKWMMSFDNYMVAAAAVGQWTFAAAYAHKAPMIVLAVLPPRKDFSPRRKTNYMSDTLSLTDSYFRTK